MLSSELRNRAWVRSLVPCPLRTESDTCLASAAPPGRVASTVWRLWLVVSLPWRLLEAVASAATTTAPGSARAQVVRRCDCERVPGSATARGACDEWGWAYCLRVTALARRFHYALVCGRYYQDGHTGYGLRSRGRLDWGDPAYLASLALKVVRVYERVGGELVLLGVSYSGFGVAALASHHPELAPNRLIVIDSFLDLVSRRAGTITTYGTAGARSWPGAGQGTKVQFEPGAGIPLGSVCT
jgi:hypothetical protein